MKIETPYQCPKNIDHMPKTAMGRYCDFCHKEVFDFTKKPTSEIIDLIKANNGTVCGQIPVSRLSAFKNYTSKWRYFLISLISLKSLFFHKVIAQNIEQKEADQSELNTTISREIKGEVMVDSNVMVREAIIEIYRNKQLIEIVKGDIEGKFNIVINDSPAIGDTISLKVYKIGVGGTVVENLMITKYTTNLKLTLIKNKEPKLKFEEEEIIYPIYSGKLVSPTKSE